MSAPCATRLCGGRSLVAQISRISLLLRKRSLLTAITVKYSTTREPCALRYAEYGDPSKVVQQSSLSVPEKLEPNEVKVKMLASPINPADINTIQGVYPIKPDLPAIAGFEGVGEVVDVGQKVTKLTPGTIVIPGVNAIGTWCTHVVGSEDDWLQVPEGTPTLFAATLRVNNCTAYRMLKDFVNLKPGDVMIQNAANSGCGQAVIQIAAAKGIKTVNIIRDRPNLDEVRSHLKNLGATEVVTDSVGQKGELNRIMKDLPKPKLALNAVGGKAAITLMKYLEHGGTMVTYGGMSRQPVTVPTGFLIFNDVRVVGHWMSRWHDHHGNLKN
ncbi:enoyl-[acyl-carrier-protein] reductase, mitochondrial-like isoform X2 [Ptychodera flava]|uniref:enoyl-[acyl-carrier-protein] reductase, mitochondrial-like isoform X2 n=1 Tax=Ptychodera flava TaxID=63121 RepID=UPI00396A087B